jgi:predicted nucleic acid-binding protein
MACAYDCGLASGYHEIESEWVTIADIKGRAYLGFLPNDLDIGEAEAIILATEMDAEALIMDERTGYLVAKSQGINVIGTLTVLSMAKQKHLIESVRPILDEMVDKGRWYSRFVYETFLSEIGEL